MKIGDLRHRVTVQEAVKTPDGHKGFTVSWRDLFTAWASVKPLSGREYFTAHQMAAEITHRVKIRYRQEITVKMRIKHEDRVLNIESIIDLEEKHLVLEILCREEK